MLPETPSALGPQATKTEVANYATALAEANGDRLDELGRFKTKNNGVLSAADFDLTAGHKVMLHPGDQLQRPQGDWTPASAFGSPRGSRLESKTAMR